MASDSLSSSLEIFEVFQLSFNATSCGFNFPQCFCCVRGAFVVADRKRAGHRVGRLEIHVVQLVVGHLAKEFMWRGGT